MQPLVQQRRGPGVFTPAQQGDQQGVFEDLALGATAADTSDVGAQRLQQPGTT